ncbi:MAG: DUF368 domain-containing protein [Clostridiales bacterium]|jgi:putative membrane protein|nr:DUF368 domain-containing protein [Clostridiales bacterium]
MKEFLVSARRFLGRHAVNFVKGIGIGLSVIVPGVSGGTMAIIMGIYHKLLAAVNNLFRKFRECAPFLAAVLAGAAVGILSLSYVIKWALENHLAVTNFLFIGVIIGGFPIVIRESGISYTKLPSSATGARNKALRIILDVALVGVGVGIVAGLIVMQGNIAAMNELSGAGGFFFRILAGVLAAIALVLPGVSGSQFLIVLGLYESVNAAVSGLLTGFGASFAYLLPFGIGVIGGIIISAKALDKLFKKFNRGTYLVIFGFLLGAVAELALRAAPSGITILYCAVSLLIGFGVLLTISFAAENIKKSRGSLDSGNGDAESATDDRAAEAIDNHPAAVRRHPSAEGNLGQADDCHGDAIGNHPAAVRRHEPSRQTACRLQGQATTGARPVQEARHSIEGNLSDADKPTGNEKQ